MREIRRVVRPLLHWNVKKTIVKSQKETGSRCTPLILSIAILICLCFGSFHESSPISQQMALPDLPQANVVGEFESNPQISSRQTYPLQEWTVDSNVTRENEEIVVTDLIVESQCSLVLRNCTLVVNSTQESFGKISVYGSLNLTDTIVKAANQSWGYRFWCYSGSTFFVNYSHIRDVGIWSSYLSKDLGIYAKGTQTIFQYSNITNCGYGLVATTANPILVSNCRIENNYLGGVVIEGGSNVELENVSVVGNGHLVTYWYPASGIQLQEGSVNNIIRNCNISGNKEEGIVLLSSNNNTMIGNRITNQPTGIYLELSTDNRIEANRIEAQGTGIGILLAPGSMKNIIHMNSVESSRIGIKLSSASPNNITENIILESQENGIYLEKCKNGAFIYSNEMASSETALEISESHSVKVENNNITVSSVFTPAIRLVKSDNCSFIANQILGGSQALHIEESANTLVSHNSINLSSRTLIYADSLSVNVTLTILDDFNANIVQLLPGATLKLIPEPGVISIITCMTLQVDNKTLSEAKGPKFELILNSSDLGGGNFTVVVVLTFVNSTETNWSFELTILAKPKVSQTSSQTSWQVVTPLSLTLTLVGILLWHKTRKRNPSKQ